MQALIFEYLRELVRIFTLIDFQKRLNLQFDGLKNYSIKIQ